MRRRWWLALALLAAGCANRPADRAAIRTVPVELLTVQPLAVAEHLVLTGTVEPVQAATVSAQLSARVERRVHELGDRVRAGEPVVLLEPDLIQAQLDQARAAVQQSLAAEAQAQAEYRRSRVEVDTTVSTAEANLEQAGAQRDKSLRLTRGAELAQTEANFRAARRDEQQARRDADRMQMMLREGAASDQAAEKQQTAYQVARERRVAAEQGLRLAREGARSEDRTQARAGMQMARAGLQLAHSGHDRLSGIQSQVAASAAQVERARASLRESEITLERCRILAPFDGRVLAIYVQRGDLVKEATAVARIGRIDPVKVVFGVPERDRIGLRRGQSVSVRVGERVYAGRIRQLGYEADPRTHSLPVEVAVANPGETLLPNQVARLELTSGPVRGGIHVPLSCLGNDGVSSYVFVVENGTARRRNVTLGQPGRDQVEVTEGLHPGDRVARDPIRLSDGLAVVERSDR